MRKLYAITTGLALGLLVSHPVAAVALLALVWAGTYYARGE